MTRLADKIPVEPLDPARLARIEDQVAAGVPMTAPTPRRRPLRVAHVVLVATGVALAAAAVTLLLIRKPEPELPAGVAASRPDSAGETPAPRPSPSPDPGQVLGREPKGQASASLSVPARVAVDGAALEVSGGGRVALEHAPDGGTLVELTDGRLVCDVEPRGSRAPFRVRAGDVTVEVVGTRFSVERDSDVRVAVMHGVVRVAVAGGPSVSLTAGATWSRSGAAAGSRPGGDGRGDDGRGDGPGGDGLGGDGRGGGPGSGTGPEPGVSKSGDSQSGDSSLGDSKSGDSQSGDPERDDSGLDGSKSVDSKSDDSKSADSIPRDSKSGSAHGVSKGPGSATDGAGEVAASLRGLPELACTDIETCRATALEETGPRAGQALYSLIVLELTESKNPAQALTLADLYERRFARRRAVEAEAVLWLRALAHRQAGDAERSRDAAADYLARHPRGRFAAEANRLLGR